MRILVLFLCDDKSHDQKNGEKHQFFLIKKMLYYGKLKGNI